MFGSCPSFVSRKVRDKEALTGSCVISVLIQGREAPSGAGTRDSVRRHHGEARLDEFLNLARTLPDQGEIWRR